MTPPVAATADDAPLPAQFENDIFVSYAHIDDQVIDDGQTGWIATLHRALEVRSRSCSDTSRGSAGPQTARE